MKSQELDDVMSTLKPYGQDIVYIGREVTLLDGNVFANELNRLGPLLIGLASELNANNNNYDDFERKAINNPISFDSSRNLFRVYLKSDLQQWSLVALKNLPSGWIRYGTVCSILFSLSEGSVVLLDEPELNLHPKLQHRMIQRICEIATSNNIQVFIATHSNVFINTARWGYVDVKIFLTKGQSATQVDTCSEVLERLGFKASDLLQTDGVIWIEGPSDRLYIEYWMNKWCEASNKERPQENVDYCYSFYGGSVLSHFQADEGHDLIDLLKINKNAYIVIDNDNDFKFCSGTPIALVPNSTKERIFKSVNDSGGGGWITKGYTIESYLISSFRDLNFDFKDEKLVLKDGKRKVDVAEKYVNLGMSADDVLGVDDLKDKIGDLYEHISSWSSFN
nr:AAA family ATPase [uncultured Pseudogulbenkiania sp.]